MTDSEVQIIAARYTAQPCGKTARGTSWGAPYTYVCQQKTGHGGRCRDIDNGLWFDPEETRSA